MLLNEAIKKMHEAAVSSSERFEYLGLATKIELDYMDKLLNPVSSPEGAKFVFVSTVISHGADAKDEYSMSLGAEIQRGNVDGDVLERDIVDFISMTEEVYERLSECEDINEEIRSLTAETSDEYSSFLESFPMSDKKNRKTMIAVIAAVVFAVAAIIAVTVMALGG